ncbi:uncharacterized protein LOC125500021 [Athalia rosae]|uniref:uncharacterized protein LOC125500021 n=1 Tax=Athalia rosae TaxID=37344 RepID=UPI00203346B9|nr:uncharacterized protein LOC125500021 [Athalia rosae]
MGNELSRLLDISIWDRHFFTSKRGFSHVLASGYITYLAVRIPGCDFVEDTTLLQTQSLQHTAEKELEASSSRSLIARLWEHFFDFDQQKCFKSDAAHTGI